jgi:hypothetical protein
MDNHFWLKLAISAIALGVILARVIWPNLRIDAITLGLLIVAVLPWLAELIESAKFPGGWEVKFRNVQSAAQKVLQEAPAAAATAEPDLIGFERGPFQFWTDPNIALVALRIEIEKRIREIARRAGISDDRSMLRLFNRLRERGVLQQSALNGLQELVAAGNQAAHGARVEPNVAAWALDYGPQVIAVLDARLKELQAG